MTSMLLVVDAWSPLDRLLPAAMQLAARNQARVRGVFATDAQMLQGAALSFTREIGAASANRYSVSSESLTMRLRQMAAQTEKELAVAAKQAGVSFAFESCVGTISQIARDASEEIVLPGWNDCRWPHAQPQFRPDQFLHFQPLLCRVQRHRPAQGRPSNTLLTTAEGERIVILSLVSESANFEITPSERPQRDTISDELVRVTSTTELMQRIRQLRPTLLLISHQDLFNPENPLDREIRRTGYPVVVFR